MGIHGCSKITIKLENMNNKSLEGISKFTLWTMSLKAQGGASSSSSQPLTPAQSGSSAQANMSQGVISEMPAYYKALEAQMPGYTTATTNAANQGLASTMAADTSMYQQYVPLLNQISQQMGASNLQSNTNAIGNTLNSSGAQGVVGGFNNLQSQMNPAYQSTMGGLASMMQNQNPNALSGSEQAQVERGLNQMNYSGGNQGVGSPLTAINNAATFGTALQSKQANFANLASSSANTANTLQGGQNAFGLATGQPSGTSSANTSTSSNQFLTSPNNALGLGNMASGVGSGIMNQLGSTFNAANTSQVGQQTSQGSSAQGGVCCFVFILGNQSMPWFVRSIRDVSYGRDPSLQDGYITMARILVPLMYIPCIYWLVKTYMVMPLMEHAGYIVSEKGCKPRINYQKFWFAIWKSIAKIKSIKL